MMKKRFAFLSLVLCFALLLSLTAFAADVRLSNQSLKIDGESVYAQAYNIDGSNYFRLRDLAYLLSGTEACFSVSYVKATNSVVIVTGEDYTPIGTELDASGSETPASAVPSPQALVIDGETVSGLSAYNIDGSNYFQLRALGEALGFDVDYDEGTRTMLVSTGPGSSLPEDWSPDIRFTTQDAEGKTWTDACFHDAKLTMINFWAYWCGPCISEMPDLQKLQDEYADEGLQILGISERSFEEDNVAVMEEMGITYPCLRYTSDFDYYLSTGYIPTTVFVDSNGRVVGEVQIGSNSYRGWASIIESLLP